MPSDVYEAYTYPELIAALRARAGTKDDLLHEAADRLERLRAIKAREFRDAFNEFMERMI